MSIDQIANRFGNMLGDQDDGHIGTLDKILKRLGHLLLGSILVDNQKVTCGLLAEILFTNATE